MGAGNMLVQCGQECYHISSVAILVYFINFWHLNSETKSNFTIG